MVALLYGKRHGSMWCSAVCWVMGENVLGVRCWCVVRGVSLVWYFGVSISVGHSSYGHVMCECLMLRRSTGEEHGGSPMSRHGADKWDL